MAVKLNLLPQDYAVSDSVAQVLKVARPLNVILLGIFLVTGICMGGYFVFSSITMQGLNSANNTLKSQIQSQQKAQQQIVLLKDRLTKIRKVYAKPTSTKNLKLIQPILATLPEGSFVTDLSVDPQKINVSFNFKTNSALTSFISNLNSQVVFSTISMESFGYSQPEGYIVEFSFIPSQNKP